MPQKLVQLDTARRWTMQEIHCDASGKHCTCTHNASQQRAHAAKTRDRGDRGLDSPGCGSARAARGTLQRVATCAMQHGVCGIVQCAHPAGQTRRCPDPGRGAPAAKRQSHAAALHCRATGCIAFNKYPCITVHSYGISVQVARLALAGAFLEAWARTLRLERDRTVCIFEVASNI